MKKTGTQMMVMGAMLVAGAMAGLAEPAKINDPQGVLRKPVPDKIVVLTFDDGPASLYTVVAPILKTHGFNGSFYVCDFDSFRTRKDWYLTFRQMKEMAAQGFEIGNHSVGHSSGFDAMIRMEDELLANHVPKPTTIAWPLHQANVSPELPAAGYIFARGGHNRAYRPTVDNPFEIPSLWCYNLEEFVKMVRQAAGGKIVAICYHGVPDMEHPGVSLDPEVFKVQMQYLKDNHYKVIALRDLVDYIDPVKAEKLPKTIGDFKDTGPVILATEEKPCGVVKPVKPEAGNESQAPTEKAVTKLPALPGVVIPIDNSRPNVFTWRTAEGGNWSDASKWSNNLACASALAPAGQADYVLSFCQSGASAVKNDLNAGFLLNRLLLSEGSRGMKLSGNGMTFAKKGAKGVPPAINAVKCGIVDINVPVNIPDGIHVNTSPDKDPNCFISFNEVISGSGALTLNSSGDPDVPRINFHDVHFGILQINNSNTYSGGTRISGGKINVRKSDGLGTGSITLDNFGTLSSDSVLANPLTVNAGTLFHCSLSGPVILNGIAHFIGDCAVAGNMSGPGGIEHLGRNGTYLSMVPGGSLTLQGTNTYTGSTTVFPGTLIVKKAAGLYKGDATKWTPDKITIHKAATLRLSVGGPGEFTGEQVGTFLKNLTTSINKNGLMGGAVLCLDTSNAKAPVTVAIGISDSKGPGGGAFLLRKCGVGTLQFSGKNSYTGQTILEDGALSVASLNSFTQGKGTASSSLGAPADIEAGEIVIGEEGKDSECALIYTGQGETSDRVMNLAGKTSTLILDHAGKGLLKLTSDLLISGYGANKTITLKGDTQGIGEFAGAIANPHDRAGKAVTSITKSGTGTWILSGVNSYTGLTTVAKGTLVLATAKSLGEKTDVSISEGAILDLDYKGEMRINKLVLDGKIQTAGVYSAKTTPRFIKGKGILKTL